MTDIPPSLGAGSKDEQFMTAALELAGRGRGAVEPNPVVGAIIVCDGGQTVGGWHGKFGGPHAEIEALEATSRAGYDVSGGTMYVTLEPCCHHDKTPPCTDAIIAAKLARVVVAMEDPDENVHGRGIAALLAAGLKVDVGVCEQQGRELLAGYIKLRTEHRPWVICKWAQTADGYIAIPSECGRWISGEAARAYVHELRGLCDAICVGVDTVIADDPLLTNRSGTGKQPVRIVLDSKLRMPLDCQLLRTTDVSPVLVATTDLAENTARAEELRLGGAEVLGLPSGDRGVDLAALLDELGRRQWTYLLVEGGAKVLSSFIHGGLADELLAFMSPKKAPPGNKGFPHLNVGDLQRAMGLGAPDVQQFAEDSLLRYRLGR